MSNQRTTKTRSNGRTNGGNGNRGGYKVTDGRKEVETRITGLYNLALALAPNWKEKRGTALDYMNQMDYLARQIGSNIRGRIDKIWSKTPSEIVPFEMCVPDNNGNHLDWSLMIVRPPEKGIGPYYEIVYKNGSQKVIAKGRKAACERCIKSSIRLQARILARKKAEEEARQAKVEAKKATIQLLDDIRKRIIDGEPFVGKVQSLVRDAILTVKFHGLNLMTDIREVLELSIGCGRALSVVAETETSESRESESRELVAA